jgi:uridine phosphorylase
MARIQETDLILNEDGSVYHLNLLPEHLCETILAVGDPNRVHLVSKYFDEVSYEVNKREFITHGGRIGGKKVMVISSGIGTDNVEILLTELDALANIDLKTREPRPKKTALQIIRIGTSGALQEDIDIDSLLISDRAVGLDNLMAFYTLPQSREEQLIGERISIATSLPFTPYVVSGSQALAAQFGSEMIRGNTVTCPGFYAPQGRSTRIPAKYPGLLSNLTDFHVTELDFWLTNFEMETAGYYALGRLLGHEVLSANAIIANRSKNRFSRDPSRAVDALIRKILEKIGKSDRV